MSCKFIEKRNIIVIGRIGTGKSTLINKVVGKERLKAGFSFSAITEEIKQIAGKLKIDECNSSFDVTFIDTVGLNDGAAHHQKTNAEIMEDIKEAITDRLSHGVNLIIITLNIEERFTSYDKELFDLLQLNFKGKFWDLSILVFTHCDRLLDKKIEERLEIFKDDRVTKEIADKFGDRIVTVGFPCSDDYDESNAEEVEKKMKRDTGKLHKCIEKAAEMELPKYIIQKQETTSTNNTSSSTNTEKSGCIIL